MCSYLDNPTFTLHARQSNPTLFLEYPNMATHPHDACPTRAEQDCALQTATLLSERPNDRTGNRNRAIVLLTVLGNPGTHASELAKLTRLSISQVARAVRVLQQANLLVKRRSSADSLKIQCCFVTETGAAFIKQHILPHRDTLAVATTRPLARTKPRRKVYRNVVHPTLLSSDLFWKYRRAMRQRGIAINLDRFALSLILFLGKDSSLDATWYQSELYPVTPTRRVKEKHRETDSDTISRYNVQGRFGKAVRHLCDLCLVRRWQDPESKKTAWLFQKLPALDALYERINESLRQKA